MPTQVQPEHTIADLLNPPDGKLYELVRGQLVEKEVGALAVLVAFELAAIVRDHVRIRRRGWVATELPITCFPWLGNHGRRPDVACFQFARQPAPTDDHQRVNAAPNFVVEVLSPTDEAVDLDVKIEEYFRAGVELVWVVNPQTRTVRVQKPDGSGHTYHEHEQVPGDPMLPEFRPTVADFVRGPRPPG